MDKPLVSISCLTYNHEDYIKQCLEGFLMQKCNFDYEILIHDDASTDETAKIIKEYEIKYPNLIKPIYQKENQYSQGVRGMMSRFNFPRAQGKYIALCEGDDYWTDPLKLQKQVDFLEENEECNIIFHPCKIENDGVIENKCSFTKSNTNIEVNAIDVLKTNTQFAPTASYLFKKKILDDMPSWINEAPIGDFFIEMYSLKNGKGLYLNDCMSVYRVNTKNSWTIKILNNKENRLFFNIEMIKYIILLQKDFPKIPNEYFYNVLMLKYQRICKAYFNTGNFKEYKFYSNKLLFNSKYSMYLRVRVLSYHKYVFVFIRYFFLFNEKIKYTIKKFLKLILK